MASLEFYKLCEKTVDKIVDIFAIYEPDYVEPEKIAQSAMNVLEDWRVEIEARAADEASVKIVSNDRYAGIVLPETPLTLEEAMEKDKLDFSEITMMLIPQHTKRFDLRENFIKNIIADALAVARLKECMPKSEVEKKDYELGVLRETRELAEKAHAAHPDVKFSGLEEYLEVIFPGSKWVHDKAFSKEHRIRPDYRCDELRLIVEFDGTPHYTDPSVIAKDNRNQRIYEDHEYTVVRIPYFIQLTRDVVKELFGVDVGRDLCDPSFPSMGKEWENTPAYCCTAGLKRMAEDFDRFNQQLFVNIKHLIAQDDNNLTGVSILKWFLLPQNRYIGTQI